MGDDRFVGGTYVSYLAGSDYRNETHFFDEVHAVASISGSDVAWLSSSLDEGPFWGPSDRAVTDVPISSNAIRGFDRVILESQPEQLDQFYLSSVDHLFSIDFPSAGR